MISTLDYPTNGTLKTVYLMFHELWLNDDTDIIQLAGFPCIGKTEQLHLVR
jgi:hypothetical protein